MIREQFIATFDQELAAVRDRINSMVETYQSNVEHIAECDVCTEIDNITKLVLSLAASQGQSPKSLVAYLAVAVKMLAEARMGRNDDLP